MEPNENIRQNGTKRGSHTNALNLPKHSLIKTERYQLCGNAHQFNKNLLRRFAQLLPLFPFLRPVAQRIEALSLGEQCQKIAVSIPTEAGQSFTWLKKKRGAIDNNYGRQ